MSQSILRVSRVVVVLFLLTLTWACFSKVDIIAEAPGKLIPTSYLKIVQPADAGVVTAILVSDGEEVKAGQVVMKLDPVLNEADRRAAETALKQAELTYRRIEAELKGTVLSQLPSDEPILYASIALQLESRKRALNDSLAQETAALRKLESDQDASTKSARKLQQEWPTYMSIEESYDKLIAKGLAGKLTGMEKKRDRLEKERELEAAQSQVKSLDSSIDQQRGRVAAITSEYRKALLQEQVDISDKLARLKAEFDKFEHKAAFLELRAPQDGIVKEVAVRSIGTVVSPGTVLLTLVPQSDPLQAEVLVRNEDVGFIYPTQTAQVKVAALPFQKYGLVDATVGMVTADAAEAKAGQDTAQSGQGPSQNGYRTLVKLKRQYLTKDGKAFQLKPGMQVVAEVNLGTETVMEYLLSPVKKTLHESIRER